MKQLLPHQTEDSKFLASQKFSGCFSGMGSGKTLTALEAVRRVACRHHLPSAHAVIIVGPPISLSMWKAEFEEFFSFASLFNTGELKDGAAQILKRGKDKIDPDVSALIMSYEIATKRKDELKQLGAKVLICDESHALKSTKAKRTKALIGRRGLC